ncbi:MAG: hypothetical protein HOV76_14680 [Hamadaea sp.]|nr:hypothetical protein [Catenulispora sp.]NUT04722.1 hypothetical protein [Hamadaea sp.]
MTLLPNNTIVAAAWLRLAVPGIGVATKLPTDLTPLRTSGFIRIAGVGGSPDLYVPMSRPAVQVECWAAPANEGSSKPPWNRANELAEQVKQAAYDRALMGVTVDLSSVGDYGPARVETVQALSEPTQVENDPSNLARYDIDLLLSWVAV